MELRNTTAASMAGQGSSLGEYLRPKLVKGFLLNLDNNRENVFLFNPATLEESYQANYAQHGSVGLSHKRMHYVGHENAVIPLRLVFDQAQFNELRSRGDLRQTTGSDAGPAVQAQNDVENWRRRLLEMHYPRRAQRLTHASPPPILFHWPGMINMRVRLTKLKFKHVQFQGGRPLPRIMVAEVELVEEPLERIYSEDMLRTGTWRPWGAGGRTRRSR